ncbi:hypothetical protein VTJ83DRAFT_3852 [Remersonia thermophila]|uniref:Protein LOT5 n=1 Tax=Remersonia thermophila TaxID=72144 RepID=A0ABR4DFA6_9PEZI
MSLQTVRRPFAVDDYTPLSQHLEQTPESFFDGKPVLFYHAAGAKAWIPKSQRDKLPFFPADLSSEPTAPESSALADQAEEPVEQNVDVFVNSRDLSLFSPAAECGVSIPYQQITIHAIKKLRSSDGGVVFPAVYLQLDLADGGAGDDDFDTIELTLIPPAPATNTTTAAANGANGANGAGAAGAATAAAASASATTDGDDARSAEATRLFEAISECSNLNPDPVQDGEDADDAGDAQILFEGDYEPIEGLPGAFAGSGTGGLPPPLPGSGGWITAENVHEYFDEEGNWIGGDGEEEEEAQEGAVSGELGEGAGAVHPREEDGKEPNGTGEEVEVKRPRRE